MEYNLVRIQRDLPQNSNVIVYKIKEGYGYGFRKKVILGDFVEEDKVKAENAEINMDYEKMVDG